MKICFLTKKEKPGVKKAINYLKKFSDSVEVFSGYVNDPIPKQLNLTKYDIIISYLSPWIVPQNVLNKTKKWNINFHPGPPEYPGIGCFNFALFNLEIEYGVTAHLMRQKVDTGDIIGVKRFPISNEETVETLSNKTYDAQLILYKELIKYIMCNKSLPKTTEKWKRKPYKRSELETLATIKPEMSKEEINKRIRATYFKGKPAPFIVFYGKKYEFNPER